MTQVPESGFDSVVEKTWLLSSRLCDRDGRFEVLPDGHFGLGVVLYGSTWEVIAGGPITRRLHPWVGRNEIYWLRFRPGRMPRIADVRPRDLVDVPGITLDRVRQVDLQELGERMLNATSAEARLSIAGGLLRPVAEAGLCQDRRCRRVLHMVDALDGRVTVKGLGEEFGLSPRTIQRMLRDQVGLSPKQLIRNVRLQRTLDLLRTPPAAWGQAELASACGFADQSHLIREFRTLTGRLPSSF